MSLTAEFAKFTGLCGAGKKVMKILSGCNWYGFGAVFFGCLSMLIHGGISVVRYLSILHPSHSRTGIQENVSMWAIHACVHHVCVSVCIYKEFGHQILAYSAQIININ